MYKRVPGTKDILPEECFFWLKIEQISRQIFSIYNYREIRTPVIEEAALFRRGLGESTEIVQKQMFLVNSNEDTYALRPEATASIVRSYIENNLDKAAGFMKLFYIGPMFRRERPQKGRLRQFHHIGCEAIGSREPGIDIEIISLADALLKAYSISGYKIRINSLGCSKDKQGLSAILHKELKNKLGELCGDCGLRFTRNVLRILDCKNESCREIVSKLDINDRYLCADCKAYFARVRQGLDSLNLNYEVSPCLVRGLDYYTGTVFEINHDMLGAQDAIGAGGRYDNLVKELGGPDAGAIGFAFGMERLLLAVRRESAPVSRNLVYIIALGKEAGLKGLKLLDDLRNQGVTSDTDYENKSLKGAMRKANDAGARYVLIIGEDELKKNVVTLKDMVSGQQKEVKTEALINELKV